jgi:mannosyltransferase OCH1-like enzyme
MHEDIEQVPDGLRQLMIKLQGDNPLWTHHYYNHTQQRDFIRENMPLRVLRAYDALNVIYGPAKADIFRYCVIYILGGAYLDCKSSVTKPLDKVFSKENTQKGPLLTHWSPRYKANRAVLKIPQGEIVNWVVASPARHPFLLKVIMYVTLNIEEQLLLPSEERESGKVGVLRVTGPIAYSRAMLQYVEEQTNQPSRQESGEMVNSYNLHIHPSAKGLGLRYTTKGYSPDTQEPWHYSKIKHHVPVVLSAAVTELAKPEQDLEKARAEAGLAKATAAAVETGTEAEAEAETKAETEAQEQLI